MSRIYDGLKSAQEVRSKSGVAAGEALGEMKMAERRSGPRLQAGYDLIVYGHSTDELPFYEQAKAIEGNANGGLMRMIVPVQSGQDLLLINNRSSQEQLCRVVSVTASEAQTFKVAVAFTCPNDGFWEVLNTD